MPLVNGYHVNQHGIIVSPGKFEGERWFVPELWEIALEGGADGDEELDGTPFFIIRLSAEDRTRFRLDNEVESITLVEDDNGFVYASLLDAEQTDDLYHALAEQAGDADED